MNCPYPKTRPDVTQVWNGKWKLANGVYVVLPCDKRTYRVCTRDGDQLDPRSFRNWTRAVEAALLIEEGY